MELKDIPEYLARKVRDELEDGYNLRIEAFTGMPVVYTSTHGERSNAFNTFEIRRLVVSRKLDYKTIALSYNQGDTLKALKDDFVCTVKGRTQRPICKVESCIDRDSCDMHITFIFTVYLVAREAKLVNANDPSMRPMREKLISVKDTKGRKTGTYQDPLTLGMEEYFKA